mgnify:CR=1 FL=1
METEINAIKEEFNINQRNKNYKLMIILNSNDITLNIAERVKFEQSYEINLNLEQIKEKHIIFSKFYSLEEFQNYIKNKIENKEVIVNKISDNTIKFEFEKDSIFFKLIKKKINIEKLVENINITMENYDAKISNKIKNYNIIFQKNKNMEKEKPHYSAFISYRHTDTDTAVARHIQQKLEHFKAPKAIREKYGIAGFDKLFRDQEELQTGKDLSAMIQEALDHSDYLIVICSPQYSESKWCQLEVESFLEKHDPDHVLCVLSSGEPPAIFPEALMKEAEPLACDYRMNFSKADRIELPRLISAMIGCSYDELIMRQERYRKKRRTIILSILFAFAAVVIAYLLRTNAIITANYHQAQINESAMLARESLNDLAEAKRLDALNLAMEALAEGRPETDDAFYALSKAANAYVTPYQYTESWRIDPVSDIESFLLSEDGNYIICKDNQALFHTISILDPEEKASFYLGEDVLSYETRKDHQLLAYGDGSLRCVDYLSGETVFETQMKYQAIGMSTQSGSGKYIATADSYAVQVTDEQGSPFLSMPLPKDQDGYIVDLSWSGQDSFIAVKLRTSSRRYCIGVYDFETSQFSVVSQEKDEILDFVFLDDKTLCILSAEESESSFRDADHSRNYDRLYLLEVFNPYERLYAAEIRNNGIPAKTTIIKDGDIC